IFCGARWLCGARSGMKDCLPASGVGPPHNLAINWLHLMARIHASVTHDFPRKSPLGPIIRFAEVRKGWIPVGLAEVLPLGYTPVIDPVSWITSVQLALVIP